MRLMEIERYDFKSCYSRPTRSYLNTLLTEDLILEFTPIISRIAKYRNSKTPTREYQHEFESIGWIGLFDALRLRDSESEFFEKYACSRIIGAIIDYQRALDHLTREHRNGYRKIEYTKALLAQELLREPAEFEVVKRTGFSYKEYSYILQKNKAGELANESGEVDSEVERLNSQNINELNFNESIVQLEKGLSCLSNKEIEIFHMRYIDELTCKEIGLHFKRSEAWASLRNTAILRKIRTKLEKIN